MSGRRLHHAQQKPKLNLADEENEQRSHDARDIHRGHSSRCSCYDIHFLLRAKAQEARLFF